MICCGQSSGTTKCRKKNIIMAPRPTFLHFYTIRTGKIASSSSSRSKEQREIINNTAFTVFCPNEKKRERILKQVRFPALAVRRSAREEEISSVITIFLILFIKVFFEICL